MGGPFLQNILDFSASRTAYIFVLFCFREDPWMLLLTIFKASFFVVAEGLTFHTPHCRISPTTLHTHQDRLLQQQNTLLLVRVWQAPKTPGIIPSIIIGVWKYRVRSRWRSPHPPPYPIHSSFPPHPLRQSCTRHIEVLLLFDGIELYRSVFDPPRHRHHRYRERVQHPGWPQDSPSKVPAGRSRRHHPWKILDPGDSSRRQSSRDRHIFEARGSRPGALREGKNNVPLCQHIIVIIVSLCGLFGIIASLSCFCCCFSPRDPRMFIFLFYLCLRRLCSVHLSYVSRAVTLI